MIETRDIKNYAKTMFTRGDSGSGQDLMNPNREWFVLSMLFLILFISGALFSVQQYQMYAGLSDSIEVTRDLTVPQYQESRVLDVHEYFSQRSEQYELLLQQERPTLATTTSELVEEGEEAVEEEEVEDELGVSDAEELSEVEESTADIPVSEIELVE